MHFLLAIMLIGPLGDLHHQTQVFDDPKECIRARSLLHREYVREHGPVPILVTCQPVWGV